MRELAMRAVERSPLVGQPQDRGDLVGGDAVDGMAARRAVIELVGRRPGRPASGAAPIDLQDRAGAALRPALTRGVLDEPQQRALDLHVDASGNRAYQPERCFSGAPALDVGGVGLRLGA